MPIKKNNSNSGKQLININNLEQTKQLLADIFKLLDKGFASTANKGDVSQYLADNERLLELYDKLNNTVGNKLEKVSSGSAQFRDNITQTANELNKLVKSTESYLESKAKEQVYIDAAIQKQKQLKQIEDNRLKLQQDKEKYDQRYEKTLKKQLELIEKQAESDYDKMSVGEKLSLGVNKEQYIINKQNTFKTSFKSSYDKLMSDAMESGSKVNLGDIDNLGKELTDSALQNFSEVGKAGRELFSKSKMFDAMVTIIKSGMDTMVSLMKTGLNKQVDIYNSTFQALATQSGTSKTDYRSRQRQLNNELSDMGLRNNIATSEVQQMWKTLSDMGMSDADIQRYGLENVITKNIVPYLDLTSQSVNLLNTRLNGSFVKDIRGISKSNLEIAGGNYVTQDILNMMVSQLEPMTDLAIKELASASTEVTTMVNKLIDSGYSPEQAKAYAQKAFEAQNYSGNMLRNGSVSDKLLLTNAIQQGVNWNDPNQINDFMGVAMKTQADLAARAPGTDTAMGSLNTNILGEIFGMNMSDMYAGFKTNEKGGSGFVDKIVDITNKAGDEYKETANESEKEFSNDDYQTQKQLQEITMENLTNEFATINESLGHWGSVINTTIQTLGGMLVTYFGTKFLGSLAGSKAGSWLASAGSGIGKLVGTAGGGILAAGGGIALGVGAVNLIKNAIVSARESEDESNVIAEENSLQGTSLQGNKAAAILGGQASTISHNNTNIMQNIGAGIASATRWLGVGTLGWTRDTAKINEDDYSFFKEKIQMLGGGPTKNAASDALLVWALLAASAGRLNDVESLKDVSVDDLKEMVEESGVAPSSWDKYLNETIVDVGYLPNKTEREDQTSIDWKKLGIDYFRYGTDRIPYDNYPALLHEGEAVLTASTANEVRGLVEEYRDTKNQNSNFDLIIQSQTVALTQKLDEVVTAIQNLNINAPISSTTNSMNEQTNYKTKSSMLQMKNLQSIF